MVQPVKTTEARFNAVVLPAKDQVAATSAVARTTRSEVRPLAADRGSALDLADAVGSINAHLRLIPTALQFRVDNDTGRVVVKVVNSETNEVIRQIPTEEVLVIAKALRESPSGSGMLVNKKA